MFDTSKITSVYSGRVGCMCGCNGKYRYASKFQVQEGKRRGYEVSNDEVSDRSIKTIVGKVERFLADPASNIVEVDMPEDGQYFYVEMANGRCYAIYNR